MALGKLFILLGIIFILIGVFLTLNLRIPWFGKLPGDIAIEKENVRFYFPIVTCLLISLILSALLFFFRK